jgi:cytochrome b
MRSMEPTVAANREKLTSTPEHSNLPQNSTSHIRVWDRFVRIAHWALVISFATAYVTGEDERNLHLLAGYAAAGLIAARLVWGFTGSSNARFSHFVVSPVAIARYLVDVINRREARYLGHNPAGGAMIVLLIALLAAVIISGVLLTSDAYWGSDAMAFIHSSLASLVLGCVGVHVASVLFSSLHHRENLVWSMITGRKRLEKGDE